MCPLLDLYLTNRCRSFVVQLLFNRHSSSFHSICSRHLFPLSLNNPLISNGTSLYSIKITSKHHSSASAWLSIVTFDHHLPHHSMWCPSSLCLQCRLSNRTGCIIRASYTPSFDFLCNFISSFVRKDTFERSEHFAQSKFHMASNCGKLIRSPSKVDQKLIDFFHFEQVIATCAPHSWKADHAFDRFDYRFNRSRACPWYSFHVLSLLKKMMTRKHFLFHSHINTCHVISYHSVCLTYFNHSC